MHPGSRFIMPALSMHIILCQLLPTESVTIRIIMRVLLRIINFAESCIITKCNLVSQNSCMIDIIKIILAKARSQHSILLQLYYYNYAWIRKDTGMMLRILTIHHHIVCCQSDKE